MPVQYPHDALTNSTVVPTEQQVKDFHAICERRHGMKMVENLEFSVVWEQL